MNITNELIARLPEDLILHNEGEWSNAVLEYFAFNDGGVECETGEYFYSLVRIMKPQHILETGTHHGIGALYFALGCEHNGKGDVSTIEFLQPNHDLARSRFDRSGLGHRITSVFGDATKQSFDKQFDIILLDTEPQTRFFEFMYYWDNLKPGGYMFIHDLHRHMHQIPNEEHGFAWPFGEVPQFIKDKVANDEARPFHFGTPRGLTGFYKVAPEDYKWAK